MMRSSYWDTDIWHASKLDQLVCPRRYYYAQVEKLESLASSVFAYAGTVIHTGLDTWYSTDKDDEAALTAAEQSWGDYESPSDPDPAKDLSWLNLNHVLHVLRAYFDRWRESDAFTVLESEVEFVADYPGFRYGGRRDLKVRDEAGLIYIVDHKSTTGNMGDYWFGQFKISNQLRGYYEPNAAGVIVNGLYMGKDGIAGYHPAETYTDKSGKERTKRQRSIDAAFQRKVFTFSEKHLSEWEDNVRKLIAEVEWRTATDNWPQMTAAGICRSCDFSALCSANPRLRASLRASEYRTRGESEDTDDND